MPAIKLSQFGGMIPAWSNRLLPQGQGASSSNAYLFSGELQPWRKPKLLRSLLNSSAKFVYRVPTVSEAQAFAYAIFTAQPAVNDTITISEDTYRFVASLPAGGTPSAPTYGNPYDVLIGVNAAETALHLLEAITADYGASTSLGINYGSGTVQNGATYNVSPTVAAGADVGQVACGTGTRFNSNPYVYITSPNFGAAYNLTPISVSSSNIAWSSSPSSIIAITTFVGGTNASFDNAIDGPSTWLEFDDPDTNVAKSQVVNDEWNRYYFASPSLPPQYNTYDRIVANQPAFLLGINPPGCAPNVSIAGGGNSLQLPTDSITSDGRTDTAYANEIYLVPIVPTGATYLNDVSFMPQSTNTTVRFAGLLFADDDLTSLTPTRPGALIDVATMGTGITAGTEATSAFVNPANLLAETPYWIGIMVDQSIVISEAGVVGGPVSQTTVQFSNTYSNGPPVYAPPPDTTGLPDFQMWADCTSSDLLENRAYVYTWVSAYGEESAPSPPTNVTGWSNGVWTITLFQPVAADQGVQRNLTTMNIYRTVSATGGSTVFYFVATVPITQETYTDTITDNTVVLNNQLPSTFYFPPPEGLEGFLVMPNGVMAGWQGNEIWFCEPYFPHAWPPGYVVTTDFPIVGLGLTSGSLVACTSANPYVFTGSTPGNFSATRCAAANPCVSRGSILGADAGVWYMSPNGLIQVPNTGLAVNTTELWITREEWEQLTPQQYGRAVHLCSHYLCFGTTSPPTVTPVDTSVAQQGFTVELAGDTTSFTIWPQPGGHRLGFQLLTAPDAINIDNVILDPWTGIAMLVYGGNVYYYDFEDPAPEMQVATYITKTFQANERTNYSAMKVWFTVPPGTVLSPCRVSAPVDDPIWNTLQPGQYGTIKVYAGGVLVTAREFRTSGELLRINSGFKAESWSFVITTRVSISNIQIAPTAKELATI